MVDTIIMNKLNKITNIYSISTDINCKAVNIKNGKMIFPGGYQQPSFCRFICSFERSKQDCQNSYIYGGLQAEKLVKIWLK
ncbi:MAG: PocR ligand-binding domain-containing protein [Halanaerobiaceae bacterium]